MKRICRSQILNLSFKSRYASVFSFEEISMGFERKCSKFLKNSSSLKLNAVLSLSVLSLDWVNALTSHLWLEYRFVFHHNALENKTWVGMPFGNFKLFCDFILWWEFHKLTNASFTFNKSTFLYLSQGV